MKKYKIHVSPNAAHWHTATSIWTNSSFYQIENSEHDNLCDSKNVSHDNSVYIRYSGRKCQDNEWKRTRCFSTCVSVDSMDRGERQGFFFCLSSCVGNWQCKWISSAIFGERISNLYLLCVQSTYNVFN